jgi:hypothetical protein
VYLIRKQRERVRGQMRKDAAHATWLVEQILERDRDLARIVERGHDLAGLGKEGEFLEVCERLGVKRDKAEARVTFYGGLSGGSCPTGRRSSPPRISSRSSATCPPNGSTTARASAADRSPNRAATPQVKQTPAPPEPPYDPRKRRWSARLRDETGRLRERLHPRPAAPSDEELQSERLRRETRLHHAHMCS